MRYFIIFICLGNQLLFGQEHFAKSKTGIWKGDLNIFSKGLLVNTVPMQLEIAATDDSTIFIWKTTYTGDKSVVKDYKLILVDAKTQTYHIDEGDGIILKTYGLDQSLYSLFRVSGSILTANYHTVGTNRMLLEICSSKELDITGEVTNFKVDVLQKARLTRE
ncbi:MAG: hypothetical protein OIF50_04180 [Flavobacteriaceae bacterium]|nr:hypothetical protein [Flavobacteriaceae bacterium]